MFEKHNSIETLIYPAFFRLNYTKMPLSSSNLKSHNLPDLLLVIEARRYVRTIASV